MAEVIVNCDRCDREISPAETSRGDAVVTPEVVLCSACVKTLTPEQRAALFRPPDRRSQQVPSAPAAWPTKPTGPARRRTTTPVPAGTGVQAGAPRTRRTASGRLAQPDIPEEFLASAKKSRIGVYVMVGVVVAVAIGALVFVMKPEKGKDGVKDGGKKGAEAGRKAASRDADAPGDGETPAAQPGGDRERDAAVRKVRLNQIRSLIDDSYSRYAEIRESLDAFLKEFPGDEAGEALRRQVDAAHGKLADEEFAKARKLAARLAGADMKDQAVSKIRSVAERFGETRWYDDRGREAIEKALREIDPDAVSSLAAGDEGPGRAARGERVHQSTASPTNAVTNSGFDMLDEHRRPVDWSLPSGTKLMTEDRNRFVRIKQTRSANASVFIKGKFKLDPAWKKIHVSVRLRARKLRTGRRGTDKAMCLISFAGARRKRFKNVPEGSPAVSKSTDWVQVDGEAVVPAGAEYVVLKPGLYRALGTLDVDDITVGPEKAPRLAPRHSVDVERDAEAARIWETPKTKPAVAREPAGRGDIRRAAKAVERGDFDGARKALGARGSWGEPERSRAEKLLARMDEAEAAAARTASLRGDPYTGFLFGLKQAARKGLSEAGAYLRREQKGVPAEHAERMGHLRKRIREAELVESVIVEGLVESRRNVRLDDVNGRRIAGRVEGVEDGVMKIRSSVGKLKEAKFVDIPPEELVKAARLQRHGALTKFQLAAFAYVMGDMAAAGRWADEAKGEGVAALRDDITLLETALPAVKPVDLTDIVSPEDEFAEPVATFSEDQLVQDLTAIFSKGKGGWGAGDLKIDGLYLTPDIVLNLARRYDRTKVVPKKLSAVGGAVAANRSFSGYLKEEFTAGGGYTFAPTSAVAGSGKTVGLVLRILGNYLDREKPEFVRICFDTTDLIRGRPLAEIKGDLAGIAHAVLGRGAMPILFTVPMLDPRETEAREKLKGYNVMVRELAEAMKLPCVDAWLIVNKNPSARSKLFQRGGALTRKGHDTVNGAVSPLYRVLEKFVAGRNVPLPQVDASEADPDDRRTATAAADEVKTIRPVTGNLIVNGGFEKKDGLMPRGWSKHNWGAIGEFSVRIDRMDSHGGELSLQMRVPGGGMKPGVFTKVTLAEGKYEVRFWAATVADESVKVLVRQGERELPAILVSGDWKQYTKTFDVFRGEANVSFGLCTPTPNSRLWLDDVELEYVGK